MRRRLDDGGYQEVRTPQLIDRTLWEASGHWDKYRPNMFIAESEDRTLAVKPMNCPGHVQIFRQGITHTATCPCVWQNLARATATSQVVHSTG